MSDDIGPIFPMPSESIRGITLTPQQRAELIRLTKQTYRGPQPVGKEAIILEGVAEEVHPSVPQNPKVTWNEQGG